MRIPLATLPATHKTNITYPPGALVPTCPRMLPSHPLPLLSRGIVPTNNRLAGANSSGQARLEKDVPPPRGIEGKRGEATAGPGPQPSGLLASSVPRSIAHVASISALTLRT
jgi:hypothetical protein